jgi:hypothetical protein
MEPAHGGEMIRGSLANKPGGDDDPTLDYDDPGSFGSVEIKKREQIEFIGQQLTYAGHATNPVTFITLDSFDLIGRISSRSTSKGRT